MEAFDFDTRTGSPKISSLIRQMLSRIMFDVHTNNDVVRLFHEKNESEDARKRRKKI
jgi:hypothetical protein